MGIYINGDHNSVNINGDVIDGDVVYGGYGGGPSRPPVGFFGLLGILMLLIWVIAKFWWIVLIAASVGAIAYTTHLEREEKRRAELAQRRQQEALAARAEDQHSAYLRGESWGTYGIYPPPPGVEREL